MTLVVDTSALMAIVLGESDAEQFVAALIEHTGDACMSAATLVECEIVIEARQGAEALSDLQRVIERVGIEVVPFDADHARLATTAWRRFGKGRHPASLNLGDCFSYALAKSLRAPLLYKGQDFRQTDIVSWF